MDHSLVFRAFACPKAYWLTSSRLLASPAKSTRSTYKRCLLTCLHFCKNSCVSLSRGLFFFFAENAVFFKPCVGHWLTVEVPCWLLYLQSFNNEKPFLFVVEYKWAKIQKLYIYFSTRLNAWFEQLVVSQQESCEAFKKQKLEQYFSHQVI